MFEAHLDASFRRDAYQECKNRACGYRVAVGMRSPTMALIRKSGNVDRRNGRSVISSAMVIPRKRRVLLDPAPPKPLWADVDTSRSLSQSDRAKSTSARPSSTSLFTLAGLDWRQRRQGVGPTIPYWYCQDQITSDFDSALALRPSSGREAASIAALMLRSAVASSLKMRFRSISAFGPGLHFDGE
jgi:hypothetical protein